MAIRAILLRSAAAREAAEVLDEVHPADAPLAQPNFPTGQQPLAQQAANGLEIQPENLRGLLRRQDLLGHRGDPFISPSYTNWHTIGRGSHTCRTGRADSNEFRASRNTPRCLSQSISARLE